MRTLKNTQAYTRGANALSILAGWTPSEEKAARHIFQHRDFPAAELVLIGVFSANERRRLVYRIELEGQEIGTAIERPDDLKPWRLTLPGHCANLAHYSRADLLATVDRALSLGSIWS